MNNRRILCFTTGICLPLAFAEPTQKNHTESTKDTKENSKGKTTQEKVVLA